MTRVLRQVAALVAKDLLLELRTRDALTAAVVFSLLTLVTFSFALDLRPELIPVVGPGVLWIAVVFGATLGLGRTFAAERESGTLEGLLIAPLDRTALFTGKLIANLALMLVLELVSVAAYVLLFSITPVWGELISVLLLGTVGLAAVGVVFSAMAANTRAREVMLPVLLFPVIVPLLIGVVQALGLAFGSTTARDMPWKSLLLAFDGIYLAVGAVVFEYVLED